jgi:dTDP-4-amino-4,6-dideoxygalactose transaminase
MRARGVQTVFHYVPLHSSPGQYSRVAGRMPNTDSVSDRLVRLPLWTDLGKDQLRVIDEVFAAIDKIMPVPSAAA